MSGNQKKGFSAFLRPAAPPMPEPDPTPLAPPPPARVEADHPPPVAMPPAIGVGEGPQLTVVASVPPLAPSPAPPPSPPAPVPANAPERIRTITSTGRVRTYSANRQLPGVTYRASEERWERLKMLSIQERRPIQDIIGEAMDAYMKSRGLPW